MPRPTFGQRSENAREDPVEDPLEEKNQRSLTRLSKRDKFGGAAGDREPPRVAERKALFKTLVENRPIGDNLDLRGAQMDLNALEGLCSALKQNKFVTELLLAQNSLGPHAIGHLSSLFAATKCIKTVDLRENGLGAGSVAALIAGLGPESSLTSLDLGQNWLGAQDGIALGRALLRCPSVLSLNLASNKLGDGGVKGLSLGLRDSKLTYLNLENNEISVVGLAALRAACLPTFDDPKLDAAKNPMVPWCNCVADFFSRNASLRELILSKNPLGEGSQFVNEIGRLHPTLARIAVEDCGLTALEQMQEMLQNKRIEAIFFSKNKLKVNNVLERSLGKSHLQILVLSGCEIGSGFGRLARGLPHTVRDLRLGSNRLLKRPEPMSAETAEQIAKLVREAKRAAEAHAAEKGRSAAEEVTRDFKGRFMAARAALHRWCAYKDATKVGNSLAALVRRLPRLQNLVLSNNRLHPICAEILAEELVNRQSEELLTLDFSLNILGADGAAAFARALRAGAKIASLDLTSNQIGDLGFEALTEMLADPCVSVLHTLAVGGNYEWKDTVDSAFMFALESDNVDTAKSAPPRLVWKRTIDAMAASLEGNSTLTNLRLNDTDMRGCLRGLARSLQFSAVESLDLQRCALMPGDIAPLAAVLEVKKGTPEPRLERLDVRGNLLGNSDLGTLATVFRANKTIREIRLLEDSSGHTCENIAKLLDDHVLMSTQWRIVAWTAREACQGNRGGGGWFRGVVDALIDEGVGACVQLCLHAESESDSDRDSISRVKLGEVERIRIRDLVEEAYDRERYHAFRRERRQARFERLKKTLEDASHKPERHRTQRTEFERMATRAAVRISRGRTE
jgi:Ran GTPase-activating protein (RanGAP) involved in mRNA processing and transport